MQQVSFTVFQDHQAPYKGRVKIWKDHDVSFLMMASPQPVSHTDKIQHNYAIKYKGHHPIQFRSSNLYDWTLGN